MRQCIIVRGRVYSNRYRRIPGATNYLAHESGKIVNAHTSRELKPQHHYKGYKVLDIEGATLYVHRLVCAAFWGPPPFMDAQTNHKDHVRDNNHYKNLEWVTPKQNSEHAMKRYWSAGKSDDVPF